MLKKNSATPLQTHQQVGVCADVGVQQSALCCAGRGLPHTGRQIVKVKLREISIVLAKEAGADFQYHHITQVSRSTGGFSPIVEGLFKFAALLFSSPPFFHPMLSQLSTQRNHSARGAQNGYTAYPPFPGLGGEQRQSLRNPHLYLFWCGVQVSF